MDTARGYDAKDPHKQHHPLVAGLVSLEEAHKVIHTGLVFYVVYACWYAWRFAVAKTYALIFMFLGYACGHAYNDGLDKVTHWKWLPEALTATFSMLAINFINRTYIDMLYIYALLALFWLHAFEIFFEGELKEIEFMHETNILRTLGAKVISDVDNNKVLIIGAPTKVFSWFIQITKSVLMLYVAWQIDMLNVYITAPFVVGMLYLTYKLLKSPRAYDHDEDLDLMASAEMLAFFGLVAMIFTLLGPIVVVLLYAVSVAWLVGLNKIQWGSTIGPKV